MLRCSDGSYYVGQTDDIDKRLNEHLCGQGTWYTRKRLPVQLIFVEPFNSRDNAKQVEAQIKGWSRKKKEALIQQDWRRIKELSKKNIRKNRH